MDININKQLQNGEVARLMNVGELLHTLTEIHRILQIEENISIIRRRLTYAGMGMVAVHFIPESQYPERYR